MPAVCLGPHLHSPPQMETLSSLTLVPFISLPLVLWGGCGENELGRLWLRDCPLLVLFPGKWGELQLVGDLGGVSWPLAAGTVAHLGWGPGKEAEMNYLCVLGESTGQAGTLPAPLELGSGAGGSSWGPMRRQSPHSGPGKGRALERKSSLPVKKKGLFSNSGRKTSLKTSPPFSVAPSSHSTRPTYLPSLTPPTP